MMNAVVSKKAMASRPWFSSTWYRLPMKLPRRREPPTQPCRVMNRPPTYLYHHANTLFSDWASTPFTAVPSLNDCWELTIVQLENILVVDDEEAIREVVSTMLESKGYHCTAVSNGRAAQDQVKRVTPDLVLSDMIMPEMDGIKLLD